jgi:hypothetical protein
MLVLKECYKCSKNVIFVDFTAIRIYQNIMNFLESFAITRLNSFVYFKELKECFRRMLTLQPISLLAGMVTCRIQSVNYNNSWQLKQAFKFEEFSNMLD